MSMNRDEQPGPLTERRDPRSASEAGRANEARSAREVAAQSSLIGSASESSRFSSQPSHGSKSSVELHIEELVLHGFAPSDRFRIGDALERELTRLFTEQGAPVAITHDVEIAHLNGGAINVQPGSNAEATGIQLARAIYGGFDQ